MVRADVNERSPLRVLESTIDGGVGPGELGVVLARPGVGKTAFLVQVGLDCALRERRVLHVGIGDTVPEVRSWYDEMFVDLAAARQLEDRSAAQLLIERHRMIQTYDAEAFTSSKLGAVLEILATHAAFVPDVLLIDGLAWESKTPATLRRSRRSRPSTAAPCGRRLVEPRTTTRSAKASPPR
jgi:KaiC/GvpD/RAD55 family RecA-like ATPase